MRRSEQMAARLPHLYREGETLSQLLAVWGNQFQMLDETATEVRRAHFFRQCVSLDEAAKLAAVLDVAPEPWQGLTEYRAWVEGLLAARLHAGAVTRQAISIFTRLYLQGFERGNRITVVPPFNELAAAPSDATPALVENPSVARYLAGPTSDGLVPLEQFALENKGIDPSMLSLVITAFGSTGPEFAPLIANLTTGEAVVFLGAVPPGQRLWVLPQETAGGIEARAYLETTEVTSQLRHIAGLEPGNADTAVAAAGPPQPLMLARGVNDLWFLPLAHYDVPGLDRALLALADLSMKQGRWDETQFDASLFVMPAAASLQLAWQESTPAAIELQVPTGAMRSQPGALDAALAARENLQTALAAALRRLSAAGIRSSVSLRDKRERQLMTDRLHAVIPRTHRERGATGADHLPNAGGRFGVTEFDGSTYE